MSVEEEKVVAADDNVEPGPSSDSAAADETPEEEIVVAVDHDIESGPSPESAVADEKPEEEIVVAVDDDDATPSSPPIPYPLNFNRSHQWFLLMVSSIIVLGSIADETTPNQRTTKEKISLATATIVMCLSIIVSFALLSNKLPKGVTEKMMKFEGITVLVSLICTFIFCLLSQTDNFVGMAQDGTLKIQMNINTYYFSWIAFFSCVSILISLMKEKRIKDYGVGEMMKKFDGRLKKWCTLWLFGMIILSSASVNFANSYCDSNNKTKYCKCSKLSISVGTITVALALAVMGSTYHYAKKNDDGAHRMKAMIEAGISGVLAALFIGSIGAITGSSSPGGYVGNLYYFSWMGFLLSVVLAAECIGAYVKLVRSK